MTLLKSQHFRDFVEINQEHMCSIFHKLQGIKREGKTSQGKRQCEFHHQLKHPTPLRWSMGPSLHVASPVRPNGCGPRAGCGTRRGLRRSPDPEVLPGVRECQPVRGDCNWCDLCWERKQSWRNPEEASSPADGGNRTRDN